MGSQDPRNDRLARSWIAARCSVVVSFSARSCPSLSLPYLFDPSSSPFFHSIPNVYVFRAACFYRHEWHFMTSRQPATLRDTRSSSSFSLFASLHANLAFPRQPPFPPAPSHPFLLQLLLALPTPRKRVSCRLFPVCSFPPTRPPNSLLAARDKIRFGG